MKVTRKSMLSGKTHTREIDIDEATLLRVISRRQSRLLIQQIVPYLTADDREFLITGITPEEWEAEFGSKDGE